MQGFYNCHCTSIFDLSTAYFAITHFHLFDNNSPIVGATSKALNIVERQHCTTHPMMQYLPMDIVCYYDLSIDRGTGGPQLPRPPILFVGGVCPPYIFLNIASLSNTISIGSSDKVNRFIKKNSDFWKCSLSI